MTPGESSALLAKEKERCGIGEGQCLPRPSQLPLRPSCSTTETHHFRLLPPPACPPTSSAILPAARWGPALRATAPQSSPVFFQTPPLCCWLSCSKLQHHLRQKGGWPPRLYPLTCSPRSLFPWLCLRWVFVAVRELSLAVVRFSLQWRLLCSTGSRVCGVVVPHGFSCPRARGILPDQG